MSNKKSDYKMRNKFNISTHGPLSEDESDNDVYDANHIEVDKSALKI